MLCDQECKISVRILSEAIFSSGEQERNLVHNRVLTDQHGFVYFHAKTLKGQLKKQAFWLLNQYKSIDPSRAKSFFESIVALFGINNDELDTYCHKTWQDSYYQQTGIMKLGHLELSEQIRNYFINLDEDNEKERYYNLSPHDLIEALTHRRTGIQLEDGVVKDKMLTTYHTVKKGLMFYSRLTFDTNPTPYLGDLLRVIHSFKRIGAGIHRGRGEIETRLLVNGKELHVKDLNKEGEEYAFI